MIDLKKYRELFPVTQNSVYMNHAAVAPMHIRSLKEMRKYQEERSGKNVAYSADILETKALFKKLAGRLINGSEDQIAIVQNTSTGLNMLSHGLDWQPGDRILLNNFEFPANVYPFLKLQKYGVEIDYVRHKGGRIEYDDIVKMIRPQTRLLSISFVEFLNGYRNDLEAIGQICAENDILFCVDGIQGIGAFQFDVEAFGIDFLSCGGHKWLMWPMGTGFSYIAPRIFERVYPVLASWLSVENAWDFFDYDLKFLPNAERFEGGALNVQGIIGAIASMQMFEEIGINEIENQILDTTDYLIQLLQEKGHELFTVIDGMHRSGIVTFYHDKSEELFNYLETEKVFVSLRSEMIRVSPHFYNTKEDINELIELMQTFEKSAR